VLFAEISAISNTLQNQGHGPLAYYCIHGIAQQDAVATESLACASFVFFIYTLPNKTYIFEQEYQQHTSHA